MEDKKEYNNFVKSETLKNIKEKFNLKSNKEAENLFWEAISYNIVQNEILEMIEHLADKKDDIK